MNKQENQEVVTNINSKRGRTMSNTEVYIVAFIWYAMITAFWLDVIRRKEEDIIILIGLLWIFVTGLFVYQLFIKREHKEALKRTGWHCLRAFLLVLFVVLFIYTSHENIIYVL